MYTARVNPSSFVAPERGRIVQVIGSDGPYDAFVPTPLPRAITLSSGTVLALSRADMALGRLAGAGRLLPNPHLLLTPYVLREAVSSSRIEGTQTSLSEVLTAQAEGDSRSEEVREVQNYIAALELGLELLKTLPISKRLTAEIHERLLVGVRGRQKTPGEFRTIQNFIGSPDDRPQTALFVPPPPGDEMERGLADWERFHHEDVAMPLLVRCALLHYQFETIHPFLDGNGRLGRLLIVFFLNEQKALPSPLLYLSSYFEQHRSQYADLLQATRERGALEDWIRFFLHGVEVQAIDAVERAERLVDLREGYRRDLAGTRSRAGEIVDRLFDNPFVTAPRVSRELNISNQGAQYLLAQLEASSIIHPLKQASGRRRRWVAQTILEAVGD